MLHLHCKKSFIFNRENSDRTETVQAPRGDVNIVPDWVRETLGYRMGVKDGSIVDLTPPKPIQAAAVAPDRKAKTVPVETTERKSSPLTRGARRKTLPPL